MSANTLREHLARTEAMRDICAAMLERGEHGSHILGSLLGWADCMVELAIIKEELMAESINHPAHYNHGTYEVIDVIEDWGLGDSFHLGNSVKYIARCRYKGNELTDLRKARWYLDRYIRNLENKSVKEGK